MQFWIPVVSKYHKEYKTLADVPEKVRCLVCFKSNTELLVRQRVGVYGSRCVKDGSNVQQQDHATDYTVQYILDPIPDSPTPTIADLPDGRCFQTAEYPGIIRWKHAGALYRVLDGGVRYVFAKDFNTNTNIAVLDLEMQLQDVPVAVSK